MIVKDLINSIPEVERILSTIPLEIKNRLVVKRFPPETTIVRKDEELKRVYLICQGIIRVINEFSTGDQYIFTDLEAVAFIGDMEILADENKIACNNQTITECICIEMSRYDFMECFKSNQEFSNSVAIMLAKKLYPRSYFNGENIFYSLTYNVASFLIKYVSKNILGRSYAKIPFTRQEMADRFGVSVRAVNRVIKKMKEDNLISISKGKIHIRLSQYDRLKDLLENLK